MMPQIDGRTRIIAHLGVPTESFRSPLIYNPWFADQGVNVVVVPMGCEAEDYPAFLPLLFRLRNIVGALVTMPHKVTTVALLDEASSVVRVCGACNAVRRDAAGRLVGEMFDGEGFVRSLLRRGRTVAGRSALIVGAGGVGSAIAASLAAAGAARLGLHDLVPERAEALAARLALHFPDVEQTPCRPDPTGFDIVVNATPLGMADGDPLPLDPCRLAPETFVGEVVLTRETTAFLAAARARGCMTQTGSDMLYEQIPAYLDFFGLPSATAETLRRISRTNQ